MSGQTRPTGQSERAPLLGTAGDRSGSYGGIANTPQPPEAGDTAIQETQLSHDAEAAAANANGNGVGRAKGALARQVAPDLLRGLLMMFMALDHTSVSLSAYPHGTNGPDGEKSAKDIHMWSSDLAYALRTLTHLCAPGFAMLLGMGVAFFMASRANQGWSVAQLLKHFFKRMIAIIVVNEVAFVFVIIPLRVWLFNAVLWALAIDYFIVGVLAILINLYIEPACAKIWATLAPETEASQAEDDDCHRTDRAQSARVAAFRTINVLLLVGSALLQWSNIWLDPSQGDCDLHHRQQDFNALAGWSPPDSGNCHKGLFGTIYEFLFHQVSCLNIGIFSGFPPMSWLPLSLFGLLYGRLLLASQARRKAETGNRNDTVRSPIASIALEASLAVAFAALFVATRVFQFGNLSTHCLRNAPTSLLNALQISSPDLKDNPYLASPKAFFYIVKYPPSPAYSFFALAGCFALLSIFALMSTPRLAPDAIAKAMRSDHNPLLVFGRQALFFYATHMLMIKGASLVVPLIPGLTRDLPREPWGKGPDDEPQRGIGLGPTYFVSWATLLIILYPVCKWYSRFKARQPADSLWRFL